LSTGSDFSQTSKVCQWVRRARHATSWAYRHWALLCRRPKIHHDNIKRCQYSNEQFLETTGRKKKLLEWAKPAVHALEYRNYFAPAKCLEFRRY